MVLLYQIEIGKPAKFWNLYFQWKDEDVGNGVVLGY
jgi:hypothetical protein